MYEHLNGVAANSPVYVPVSFYESLSPGFLIIVLILVGVFAFRLGKLVMEAEIEKKTTKAFIAKYADPLCDMPKRLQDALQIATPVAAVVAPAVAAAPVEAPAVVSAALPAFDPTPEPSVVSVAEAEPDPMPAPHPAEVTEARFMGTKDESDAEAQMLMQEMYAQEDSPGSFPDNPA